jgi:uncharacterized protein
VIEFAIFGSIPREIFRPDSDIDARVQFDSDAHPTFRILELNKLELKNIFEREIDLIVLQGIENSRN